MCLPRTASARWRRGASPPNVGLATLGFRGGHAAAGGVGDGRRLDGRSQARRGRGNARARRERSRADIARGDAVRRRVSDRGHRGAGGDLRRAVRRRHTPRRRRCRLPHRRRHRAGGPRERPGALVRRQHPLAAGRHGRRARRPRRSALARHPRPARHSDARRLRDAERRAAGSRLARLDRNRPLRIRHRRVRGAGRCPDPPGRPRDLALELPVPRARALGHGLRCRRAGHRRRARERPRRRAPDRRPRQRRAARGPRVSPAPDRCSGLRLAARRAHAAQPTCRRPPRRLLGSGRRRLAPPHPGRTRHRGAGAGRGCARRGRRHVADDERAAAATARVERRPGLGPPESSGWRWPTDATFPRLAPGARHEGRRAGRRTRHARGPPRHGGAAPLAILAAAPAGAGTRRRTADVRTVSRTRRRGPGAARRRARRHRLLDRRRRRRASGSGRSRGSRWRRRRRSARAGPSVCSHAGRARRRPSSTVPSTDRVRCSPSAR